MVPDQHEDILPVIAETVPDHMSAERRIDLDEMTCILSNSFLRY